MSPYSLKIYVWQDHGLWRGKSWRNNDPLQNLRPYSWSAEKTGLETIFGVRTEYFRVLMWGGVVRGTVLAKNYCRFAVRIRQHPKFPQYWAQDVFTHIGTLVTTQNSWRLESAANERERYISYISEFHSWWKPCRPWVPACYSIFFKKNSTVR